MAKQNNGDAGLMFLGGVIGGLFAAPSQEDRQKLEVFKNHQQEFQYFQRNAYSFRAFMQKKLLYDSLMQKHMIKIQRHKALGDIAFENGIQNYPDAHKMFIECCNLYLNGFFRQTCVFLVATLEQVLKKEFGEGKRFVELIDEASRNNLISLSDKNYLHGLRIDRNDYVHSFDSSVTEADAKMVLLLTLRVLNNFLKKQSQIS